MFMLVEIKSILDFIRFNQALWVVLLFINIATLTILKYTEGFSTSTLYQIVVTIFIAMYTLAFLPYYHKHMEQSDETNHNKK